PQQAVPLVKNRLRPAAPVDAQRIARLIKDLDNDDFRVREKATVELKKLGDLAEPAVRRALAVEQSAEVRLRLESLLENLGDQNSSSERRHAGRAIEALEPISTPVAQEVLKAVAKGSPEARLTQEAKASLDRLGKRTAVQP